MSVPIYFAWKSGCMVKVDPELAYGEIKDIEDKNGACTPQALIDRAKDPTSTLHSEFEWDNPKAANEHRKSQARNIINSLMVKYPESEGVVTRAFEIIRVKGEDDKNTNVYVNSYTALEDPEMREQVMQRVNRELNAFRDRYRTLNEVSKVIIVIDDHLAKVG